MRRVALWMVIAGVSGPSAAFGCGGEASTETAASTGIDAPTSTAGDSGGVKSTGTGDDGETGQPTTASTTAPSTTDASTGVVTDGESDASTSPGTDGGNDETGGLAGCQHAWDFSSCRQGWTTDKADPTAPGAPSWACGEPPGALSMGGAHTGVWGTNLTGDYGEDESSALVSPSFSLAGCAGATIYLTFAHLYEFGSGDGGTVQMSTDGGGTWTTVEPVWNGYCAGTLNVAWSPPGGEPGFCGGDDETWMHTLVKIDDLGGEPDVRVRFVMGSNGIIEQLGWYIDRVAIEAY